MTDQEQLLDVFKNMSFQQLKDFIVEHTTKAKDYDDLSRIMFGLWQVAQSRVKEHKT